MAKILVVDDAEFLRVRITKMLTGNGHEVVEADNGAKAVAKYRENRPDAVLMDVNMPGTSGPDALAAILAVDPFVRCCFMTADDQPGRHAALLASGAAAVFAKPFASVKDVCETLKRIAGETFGGTDSLVEGGVKWTS